MDARLPVVSSLTTNNETTRNLKVLFLDFNGVITYLRGESRMPSGAVFHYYTSAVETGELQRLRERPDIQKIIPAEILATLSDSDILEMTIAEPKAIQNVRKLCEAHNAKIVISSSWKVGKRLSN